MSRPDIYRRALMHYGYDRQLCCLAEKASELSAEACRNLLHVTFERELARKIAAVEILIAQIRPGAARLIDHEKTQLLAALESELNAG